jgi:hypothetical protein
MISDTKWIIGTTVSTALALAGLLTGLLLTQFSGVNSRMDRLDDRVGRIEDRLRAVEIGLAEVKALVSGGGRNRGGGGGGPAVTPLPRGN